MIQRNEKMKTKNHLSESDLHIPTRYTKYSYGNKEERGGGGGGPRAKCWRHSCRLSTTMNFHEYHTKEAR